jgi:DNA mismatch repair ATPase MutS
MNYIFNFDPIINDLFHKKIKTEVEIDETELHTNLDIFSNYTQTSVLNTICEPLTRQGVIYLQQRLSQSRTFEEIKREQTELMYLIKNPEVLNELYSQLKKLKSNEDDILWCITQKSSTEIDNLSSGYFQHEFLRFLNKYASVLFLMNVFILLIAPIYAAFSPVIIIIMPYFYFKFFTKLPVSFSFYLKIIKNQLFQFPKLSSIRNMSLFNILTKLLSWIIYFQSIYSNTRTSQKTKLILNEIRNKLLSILNTIRINNEIAKILENTPIHNHIRNREDIPFSCDITNKIRNSYTHDWSLVLLQYNKIVQFVSVKEQISLDIKEMYQSWGHLDFMISLARTLVKGNWCIPFIRRKDTPYISITDMHHPSLESSTKNTILLDKEHMLITGANASGKSTLLKTTAICIFLAHRIGIVPAKRMETSYFRYIYTHLNIQDSTGTESLFQRESNKIKKQMKNMEKTDGLHFSIIDELFHSTNPGEAVKGAKWVLSKINRNPRVLCMVSTHFHDLTKDSKELDNFNRYYIPFVRDRNNKIQYTYKLQKGISNQNIALEILQN